MDTKNIYDAPESQSEGSKQVIDNLNVSESWKRKFRNVEKAGGIQLPKFKELSFGERFGIGFNIWAFFFGWIYFLVKGMPKQALIAFGISLACMVVALFLPQGAAYGLGAGVGVFYSSRACILNYRIKVLQDTGWFF